MINEKEVRLTAMEFKLLATLMSRRGRVQTRDQLLEDVWNLDSEVTTRTIDTHVKRVRQKLKRYSRETSEKWNQGTPDFFTQARDIAGPSATGHILILTFSA